MRLTSQEARRLFADARVARLATTGPDGQPHLVPVTYAVEGELLYTAVDAKPKSGAYLRRLRNIRAEPRVALLADRYHDDWERLWWARADGTAAIIDDPAGVPAAGRLLAARYPQYRENPPAGPVIVVTVTRWSGWAASARWAEEPT
jgi:PPOX class probable F420-dependent enzyme